MTQNQPAPDKAQIVKTQQLIGRMIKSGIVLNLVLGFAYLIMLNGLATQGFDMESLKAERLVLQRQVEVSDIALAIPASIYALESDERIQSMPNVTRKGFLELRNAEVALADF